MASVRKRGGKWYATYKDERGLFSERVTNAAEKRAAIEIARKWEEEASKVRNGVVAPNTITTAKLLQTTVEENLADFETKLKANQRTEDYIGRTKKFIRSVCKDGCITTLRDLTEENVNKAIAGISLSPRSIQARITAIKSFSKWLVARKRLKDDPLVALVRPNPDSDRRLERRALLQTEWPMLREATLESGDKFGMSGNERALLYEFAIQTGLRQGEIRSLTRGSVRLSDERPCVVVDGRSTKNRTKAKQYIKADLAVRLGDHASKKLPNAPLFQLPPRYKLAAMLRDDLAAARSQWVNAAGTIEERAERERSDFLAATNDAGEKLDFHALRHTCGAWLVENGESLPVVQQVMRHSTIRLTIDTYGHLRPGATADAVDRFNTEVLPLRATGTNPTDTRPNSCRTFAENGARNGASSVRRDAKEERSDETLNPYDQRELCVKTTGNSHFGRVAELADARDLKSRIG